jgi:hypothetical protein
MTNIAERAKQIAAQARAREASEAHAKPLHTNKSLPGWTSTDGINWKPPPEGYGTDAYKLARAADPDTSKQAAQATDTTRLEELVYNTVASFGHRGCISDEVRARLSTLPYSSVTARFAALMEKQFIIDTGVRRTGASGRNQRVLVAKPFA